MGPRGPCWPLPSLSSWQMKEPKQSSLALSNPLAPCDQTHPQLARGDRGSSRAGRTRGPQPVSLLQNPGERAIAPGSSSRGRVRPGRGRVRRGEGGVRPAAVVKDISLREPPPPLPLPPAVPGPRQRKTKTRAEETAAGAPPEKPGQKARTSVPVGRPPGSWHCRPGLCPCPGSPASPGPLPPCLSSARVSPRSGPLPGLSTAYIPCSRARGARIVRPRLCLTNRGAATPALPPAPRQCLDPPPPLAQRLTWGGRGSGRGGIPTRQKATPFIGWQRRL